MPKPIHDMSTWDASAHPERVIEKAVERMMPKESPLARQQLGKLRVYGGKDHPHEAQNPSVPLQGRDRDPNMPAPQNTVPERVRPEEPAVTGTTSAPRSFMR